MTWICVIPEHCGMKGFPGQQGAEEGESEVTDFIDKRHKNYKKGGRPLNWLELFTQTLVYSPGFDFKK